MVSPHVFLGNCIFNGFYFSSTDCTCFMSKKCYMFHCICNFLHKTACKLQTTDINLLFCHLLAYSLSLQWDNYDRQPVGHNYLTVAREYKIVYFWWQSNLGLYNRLSLDHAVCRQSRELPSLLRDRPIVARSINCCANERSNDSAARSVDVISRSRRSVDSA